MGPLGKRPVRNNVPAILIVLACGCLAGCHNAPPPPKVTSYLTSAVDLQSIGRIVMVEIEDETANPQVARDMTEALFRSMQERRLFHVDVVHPTDPHYPATTAPAVGRRWSLQELQQLRQGLGCDAVLFGAINTFQPYPRMQIGLYLRLVDLKDGRLIWAVDHVWDTRDKAIELRIRNYFKNNLAREYEPADWEMGSISPGLFEKFVAWEIAETMPSRFRPLNEKD